MIEPGQKNDDTEETLPFSSSELRKLLTRPHRLVDLVMSKRRRLAATVADEHRLPTLAIGLLLSSLLFALPFGAVLDIGRLWRVAWLLVGSLLICFPSLHIFGAYFGSRLTVMQNLCLSLSITSVAALFTFSFFPILWFLDSTMPSNESTVTSGGIAVILLTFSLLAGLAQLTRLVRLGALRGAAGLSAVLVLVVWKALFLFITYRMACALDLL